MANGAIGGGRGKGPVANVTSRRYDPSEEANMSDAQSPSPPPAKEELKAAIKAFKKRLKLTRLEEESKLTRRPTTSGAPSAIVAITPPREFPLAVWDELVKLGRLKNAGHGMYELGQE